MRRNYRVKRAATKPGDEAGTSGSGNDVGRKGLSDRDNGSKRWPWVLLCLAGVLFMVAVGISSAKPAGDGLVVSAAAVLARTVSATAGVFATFLCFMLMLNSVIKIARPGEPLPGFVWGFWVILLFSSSLYHAIQVPWDSVFRSARTGGGGGLIGAGLSWFLRVAMTGPVSLVAMVVGLTVGGSLVLGKSAWAPFAFVWMLAVSAWQWFRDFLGNFFREGGPDPADIEAETQEPGEPRVEQGTGLDELLDSGPGEHLRGTARRGALSGAGDEEAASSSLSSTVTELKERLARRDAEGAAGAGGITGQPGAGQAPDHAWRGRTGAGRAAGGDPQAQEFIPLMEQPPLAMDLFWDYPSLDILQKSEPQKRALRGKEDIDRLSRVIEKTLLSFGVVAKVMGVDQGPAVTRFELQPGPGVKVASVVSLNQDLALALAAQDVRIEAPIPGKSAIGIEVPNKEVSLVHLRDVLETREFRNSKSPLTIALGKDVSGRPVVTTLDHCLHFLIAGATGAGKSVCINSIIASLLYKARPDEVKMVLIDPKRVELSVWSRIPHLIAPVVSDPKKAAGVLRWAIKEMEARYEKFTKVGTRDIDRYNQVATPPGSAKPAMPYIVIVIDELSDLMMVAPAEVEDAIFRLAQMARASGIYLVVATQRPSVDVITGTIKANIPTRIAFAVASHIDSRTILDIAGAEKLLGRGDMLFSPVGSTKSIRAQGCYVSEREIDELVSFVSAQAKPQFAAGILSVPETIERNSEVQNDPFFPLALRIVVEAKQASVSLLQRKLPIGYSRAARLIDAMEVRGYVGTYEGSKPREVKLSIQEYMRLFESGIIGGHEQWPGDASVQGAGTRRSGGRAGPDPSGLAPAQGPVSATGGSPTSVPEPAPKDTERQTRRNPYDGHDRNDP